MAEGKAGVKREIQVAKRTLVEGKGVCGQGGMVL
jgi:hypothetical protein